jgi:phage-related minor tail protein
VANQMEELGIVIKADGTVELANGMKLSAEQISNVGKKLDEHAQALQHTEKGQKAVTASSKDMGKELSAAGDKAVQVGKNMAAGNWRQVAADLGEVAVQSRVLTVGLGAGLAVVGTIAAGLGALAYAAYEGAKAERALNDQLTLTGNFAGLVTGQLNVMAGQLASNVNGNVGKAREILAALAGTGKFTVQSMQEVGAASMLLQRYTGQSTAQVVQHFERMSDGVAKSAQKANESYHFLSIEQFKHIQLLEEQGRKQDAMRVTSEALSRHLGGDLLQNLGTLERALQGLTNWWSRMWAAAMNNGKTESVDERIERLTALVAKGDRPFDPSVWGGNAEARANLSRNRIELSAALSDKNQARRLTSGQSEREQSAQAAIDAAMKKPPKTGAAPRADRFADNYLEQLEKQLRGVTHESRTYEDVLAHLTVNVDKFTLSQGYAALAMAESIDKAKDKKLVDAAELKYLEETSAAREKATNVWLDQQAVMRQELSDREFEVSLLGKTTEQIVRLTAVRKAEQDVKARRASVLDDFAEGRISGETMNTRLNAIDKNAAQQMVQTNNLLADQFKPGWQRMLDGWKDTTQLMKEAHDNAMQGIVQSGEDMFVQWATTGKLNARGMVNGIIAEMARLQYRQSIAGPLANFANGIITNLLGGGGGDPDGSYLRAENSRLFGSRHTGGMVDGSGPYRQLNPGVFANAPRFHGGGVAGDEVPIIAKKGEGIFTREQMSNLQPAGASNQVTYAPTINIDARTDRGEVEQLVGRAVRAGQADLLDKMNRREI